MFATGPRGHQTPCYYVYFVVIVVVFIFGSGRCVVGRPHNSIDNDSPRAAAAAEEERQQRDLVPSSPSQHSALRFSPELRLEPPSLIKSINNFSPVPPVFPYQHYPSSQPPVSNDENNNPAFPHPFSNDNNPAFPHHHPFSNDNNNNPAFPHHPSSNDNSNNNNHPTFPYQITNANEDDDNEDLNDVPPFSGDGAREEFLFRQELGGSQETWGQDPDLVGSEVPPSRTEQQRWPGSPPDKTTSLNQWEDDEVAAVAVPPVVEEAVDLNVDRFHGNVIHGGFHNEDANKDLVVPELRLKTRDPEQSLPSAAAAQGSSSSVSSHSELSTRDIDVDAGPPVTNNNPYVAMPDDVPADRRKVVPWSEMLQRDVDVNSQASSSSSPSFLPGRSEPPIRPYLDDAELQQWKKIALEDLDSMDGDRAPASEDEDGPVTDIDVDYENSRNPFEDEDEDEEEENEVPEELIRQVIKAMEAPAWRQESLEHKAPRDGDDEEEELEGFWVAITDDDDYDYNYDDSDEKEYLDWVMSHEPSGPDFSGNSRLITLIFETIGTADEILGEGGDEDDEEDHEEEMSSMDAYPKEMSIWQVLTNFPFPMLLGNSDQFGGSFNVDYSYDDDDYDDEDDYYDDEYYDDDYYDDEEYDDEDYESYEDEEEDRQDGEDDDDDELDDYFYSESYEDEDDDSTTGKKQEMTVLSLPSMLA